MEKNKSKLIAIARSNRRTEGLFGNRSLLYGLPILFAILMFVNAPFREALSLYQVYFETPWVNIALMIGGLFAMAFGLHRHFLAYRKISGQVLFVYEDRVVVKNRFTRLSMPIEKNTEFRYGNSIFKLSRIRTGNKQRTLGDLNITEAFKQKVIDAGFRAEPSTWRDQYMTYAIMGLFGLSFFLVKFKFLSDEAGTFFLIGSIVLTGVLNKQPKAEVKVRKNSVFRNVLFSRHSLEGLACMVLMWVMMIQSGGPIGEIDRKIQNANQLFADSRFEEARREYENLESPERGARFKNSYAWFLTVVPDATMRNPKKAIELANQALVSFKMSATHDTLACAQMANHENDAALKTAELYKLKDRIELFKAGSLCEDKVLAKRAIASEKK